MDTTLIYIDSIIFFIGLLFGLSVVCHRFMGILRYYFIGYTIISFSAYSIFIVPIQDYLIPIPRTFIFYYKVIGSFSTYDLFLLATIAFLFIRYLFSIIHKKNIYKISFREDILHLIFYRDIVLFFLCLLGSLSFITLGGNMDWGAEVRNVRSFLSAIVAVYVASSLVKQVGSLEDSRKVISTFSLLTLINMFSEFISSFFLHDVSWTRGGHHVVFFDQTSAFLVMTYLPIILTWHNSFDKTTKFTSVFVVALIFYNYMKITYLLSGLVILTIGVFGIKNKLPVRTLVIYPIAIVAFFSYCMFFLVYSKETAKLTRIGQTESYLETIKNKPLLYIVGTGKGGLFKRQEWTEDLGEIRAMDKDVYLTEQSAFQVPVLLYFKQAGIIGLLCVIGVFMISLYRSEKIFSLSPCAGSVALCITFFTLVGNPLTYGDPQGAFLTVIAYIYMYLVYKYFPKRERHE